MFLAKSNFNDLHRNIPFPWTHLSRCLTLSSALSPVAGSVFPCTHTSKVSTGKSHDLTRANFRTSVKVVALCSYLVFFFSTTQCITWVTSPFPCHSLTLSASSHRSRIFLSLWLKTVRHWLKGRSCYGNEAGNKSRTHGYRGREKKGGGGGKQGRSVWININMQTGGEDGKGRKWERSE